MENNPISSPQPPGLQRCTARTAQTQLGDNGYITDRTMYDWDGGKGCRVYSGGVFVCIYIYIHTQCVYIYTHNTYIIVILVYIIYTHHI